MANTTFLMDALVARPAETLTWLQACFDRSCERVAVDVACAIAAVNLARDSCVRQCRASARAQAKLATAAHEGFLNVAAGLDAIASLSASALASTLDGVEDAGKVKAAFAEGRRGLQLRVTFQAVKYRRWSVESDVDVDAGGLDFKRWMDVPTLDGCQFVCAVDKDNDKDVPAACVSWPRGQRVFTVRVNVMTPVSTLLAVLHLPPEAVTVGIHGDDTATWTFTGSHIVVAYTAVSQAVEVELAVHVLGTTVFTQRLVMKWEGHICCIFFARLMWGSLLVAGTGQVHRDRPFQTWLHVGSRHSNACHGAVG